MPTHIDLKCLFSVAVSHTYVLTGFGSQMLKTTTICYCFMGFQVLNLDLKYCLTLDLKLVKMLCLKDCGIRN